MCRTAGAVPGEFTVSGSPDNTNDTGMTYRNSINLIPSSKLVQDLEKGLAENLCRGGDKVRVD